MLGIRVTVPVACFRKGLAREYLETEILPPPSTCYGFLLSLVGETARARHVGCRVTCALIEPHEASNEPRVETSVVLRTVWRVKEKSTPPGVGSNARPDYQQLLSHIRLVMWLDSSSEESNGDKTLETRVVQIGLPTFGQTRTPGQHRNSGERFGGLSLGESTHLIDEVHLISRDETLLARTFLVRERGRLTLPVWVDHVGSTQTAYVTGDLVRGPLMPPDVQDMPLILPADGL
jgi:CRISPR-associated protein Cas5t